MMQTSGFFFFFNETEDDGIWFSGMECSADIQICRLKISDSRCRAEEALR